VIFLDTSVLVQPFERSLDTLQVEMTRRASQLMREIASGRVAATTSEAVVAEVAYMMGGPRFFGRDAHLVAATLAAILSSRSLEFPTKAVCQRALDIWAARPGLGFVDSLSVANVERHDVQLASFDRQLLRSSGVTPYWPELEAPL